MLDNFLLGFWHLNKSFRIWLMLIKQSGINKDLVDMGVYFLYFYLNGLPGEINSGIK